VEVNRSNTFWDLQIDEALQQLESNANGLTTQEAQKRIVEFSKNSLQQKQHSHTMLLLVNQFKSPFIVIRIVAAILSIFLRDTTDAVIILVIILASGLLGFWQERGAADAIAQLLEVEKYPVLIRCENKFRKKPRNLEKTVFEF
jgi:Mg2+-importing ATPase